MKIKPYIHIVIMFLGLLGSMRLIYSMDKAAQPERGISWSALIAGTATLGGMEINTYMMGYCVGFSGLDSELRKYVVDWYDDRWEKWNSLAKRWGWWTVCCFYPLVKGMKYFFNDHEPVTFKDISLVAGSLALFPIGLWIMRDRKLWGAGYEGRHIPSGTDPYHLFVKRWDYLNDNVYCIRNVICYGNKVKKWKEVPLGPLLEVESLATQEYARRRKRAEKFCPGWIAWAIPKCQFAVKTLKINNNKLEFHIPIESRGFQAWLKSLIEPKFAKPKFKVHQEINKILYSKMVLASNGEDTLGDLSILPPEIRRHIAGYCGFADKQTTISNKHFFLGLLPYLTTIRFHRPDNQREEPLSNMVMVTDEKNREKDYTIKDPTMIEMLSFYGAIPNALRNSYDDDYEPVCDGINISTLKIFENRENEIAQALGLERHQITFQ